MKYVLTIDTERCKGCELCTTVCPVSLLRMTDRRNRKGYRFAAIMQPEQCRGCRQCAEICPDVAIELEGEEES